MVNAGIAGSIARIILKWDIWVLCKLGRHGDGPRTLTHAVSNSHREP